MQNLFLSLLLILCTNLFAQEEFTLNIHEISDPDGLNPLTSKAANAENIADNIFCKLLEYNHQNFNLEPALATQMPVIKELKDGAYAGGMSLTYEIRTEAVWDDGTPVTGHDYVFTVKTIKHHLVGSNEKRLSLEFIDDIVVDKNNPKIFTIYSKKPFFMAEAASGNMFVLPEYAYDAKQIMRKISIPDLNNKKDYGDEINAFAGEFNDYKYAKEPGFIVGCGPYDITEWSAGAFINLERKKDWWGDQVQDNIYLKAYPTKIVYKIIPGIAWVLPQIKKGELDIVRDVPPSQFFEANQNPEFENVADFYTPTQFVYHYLAFNSKSPKLADKKVREAISHAIDRDRIIKEIFNGGAIKTDGPISPNKPYYDKSIVGVTYDLEKAKTILAKAGWKDTDNDGILDKKIDNVVVKLRLKYNYNNGNLVRKAIGEMLKESLAQIGITLDLYPIEFTSLLENANKRNYEIIALAWVNAPGLDDLKNVWHTSSNTEGGGNRVGFGNAKTDKIIDEIRVTLDPEKRKALYLEIQQEIVKEFPYAFLVIPHQLVMVRKGFTYPELGPVHPGYMARLFQKK